MEKIIYQRYTVWKGILKTESDTIEYWDTVNKTRLFKKPLVISGASTRMT